MNKDQYQFDGRAGFILSVIGTAGLGIAFIPALHKIIPSADLVGLVLGMCGLAGVAVSIAELKHGRHRAFNIAGIVIGLIVVVFLSTLITNVAQSYR